MKIPIVDCILRSLAVLTCLVTCQTPSQAALTVSPSTLGNVFYTTETVSIPVKASVGTSVVWTVTDYFGSTISSGTGAVSSGSVTLQPTTGGEIGYFDLALVEKTGTTTNSSLTSCFAILTPYDITTMGATPYGVQTHFAQATPPAIMPLMARAGLANFRDEQYWNSVETSKGSFVWPSKFTTYMSSANTAGLHPMITLDWANQFYDYSAGQFTAPYTTTGLAGFGNFALQLLNKYGGSQVASTEVWDEYNGGTFIAGPATANKPYYYFLTLQSVWNSIKTNFPGTKVIAGATVPICHGFIKSILDQGANPYFDIVSVHPYRETPEGVDIEMGELSTLIKSYNGGNSKYIYATEFGPLNITNDAGRFDAASYLVRIIAQMRTAGVSNMYFYQMQDDSSFPYLGLLSGPVTGGATPAAGSYVPHPPYVAYANLVRQLQGWTANGRISSGMKSTTYVYRFSKSPDNQYFCWAGSGTNAAPTTMTFTIPTATATVTDIMGNATTLSASNGKVTVPLDIDPVYVKVTGTNASAFTEGTNNVVADSVSGYSKTQGSNGWYYGTATVSGTSYTPSSFTQITWNIWEQDNYRWKPASADYPFIDIAQMHPYSAWVVRRWTSTVSGTATLTGTIKGNGAADTNGVNFHIYVGSTQVYSQAVARSAVINFSVPNITLANGTNVDFAIDNNGSSTDDATGFTARVTLQ